MSADDRRADRRRRLLDAGLEQLGSLGIRGTRVRDVCAAASVSDRYFYESFDSFDAFVDAVLDDLMVQFAARVAEVVRDTDTPEEVLVTTLATGVAIFADDPRKARLLLAETLGAGGGLARRRDEVMVLATEQAMQALGALGAFPERGQVQLISVALAGATAELFLAWAEGRLDVDRDELVDFLVQTYERFTGVDLKNPISRRAPEST